MILLTHISTTKSDQTRRIQKQIQNAYTFIAYQTEWKEWVEKSEWTKSEKAMNQEQ